MLKHIYALIIGLAVTAAVAGENNTNTVSGPFFKSKVQVEAGYTTINSINGNTYLKDAGYASVTLAATNKIVTPYISATYLPKGAESATHLTAGLEKQFVLWSVDSTVFANYTRHNVTGADLQAVGVKSTDEYSAGLRINNFPLVTPSIRYYDTVAGDNHGAAVGLEKALTWEKFTLTPGGEYGRNINHATKWWQAGGSLTYKLTENFTPFVDARVFDNDAQAGFVKQDLQAGVTAGLRFTF